MSDILELKLQTEGSIKEVQRKLNEGRYRYFSVCNLLFSCLLCKSLRIKFQRHLIFSVFLCAHETLVSQRYGRAVRVCENVGQRTEG